MKRVFFNCTYRKFRWIQKKSIIFSVKVLTLFSLTFDMGFSLELSLVQKTQSIIDLAMHNGLTSMKTMLQL